MDKLIDRLAKIGLLRCLILLGMGLYIATLILIEMLFIG